MKLCGGNSRLQNWMKASILTNQMNRYDFPKCPTVMKWGRCVSDYAECKRQNVQVVPGCAKFSLSTRSLLARPNQATGQYISLTGEGAPALHESPSACRGIRKPFWQPNVANLCLSFSPKQTIFQLMPQWVKYISIKDQNHKQSIFHWPLTIDH